MSKILGYILAIVGIIGVAIYTIPQLKTLVNFPSQINNQVLLIVSIAVAVIGIFLIIKGGSRRKPTEVPIYAGKDVVGFRRIKK